MSLRPPGSSLFCAPRVTGLMPLPSGERRPLPFLLGPGPPVIGYDQFVRDRHDRDLLLYVFFYVFK